MATLTGVGGDMKLGGGPTAVADVLGWTLNIIHVSAAYASSDTAGWKKRLAGIKDWNGTATVALDSGGTEVLLTGGFYDFDLHTDSSDKYEGNAVVDNYALDVNIDDPALLVYVVTFNGNGALTGSGI